MSEPEACGRAEATDAGRFGRVEIGADCEIRAFVEKGGGRTGPSIINAGAYLLSARLLDRIAAGPPPTIRRS